MVKLKECKTRKCQSKLQQLHWEEQGKDEDHVKDGGTRFKRA
jgi:hypothetical protein